jgi:hypothetical protein
MRRGLWGASKPLQRGVCVEDHRHTIVHRLTNSFAVVVRSVKLCSIAPSGFVHVSQRPGKVKLALTLI